jgi:hypothetical protein
MEMGWSSVVGQEGEGRGGGEEKKRVFTALSVIVILEINLLSRSEIRNLRYGLAEWLKW